MFQERKKPLNKLLAEPVTRPDGRVVSIIEIWPGVIDVQGPFSTSTYSTDEVTLLGDGDFPVGLCRLGRAQYDATEDEVKVGTPRLFSDELEEKKTVRDVTDFLKSKQRFLPETHS